MHEGSPFSAFLASFPPDGELHPIHGEVSAALEKHVHPLIIKFWSEVGYGSFGDGYLHFFDPQDYDEVLAAWMMREEVDPTRVPFARTAFGDIFYWRDLRAKAADSGLPATWDLAGDISVLSVHHRSGAVVSLTPGAFFASELADYVRAEPTLYHALYQQARKQRQRPGPEDCLYFVPALALGGPATLEHLEQGDCKVHLEILLQLAEKGGE